MIGIEEARRYYTDSDAAHDFDHVLRVLVLAERIGQAEGAAMEIVRAATLLHDVARAEEERTGACHARVGAERARQILAGHPADKVEAVAQAIASHRFRDEVVPETLEAKVLYDADKLDAIGAIGIARAFQFAGEIGAKFHNSSINPEETEPYTEEDTGYREFKVKLRKIKDRMLTTEGLRMAEERHAFMEAFFERFLKEHEGIQ